MRFATVLLVTLLAPTAVAQERTTRFLGDPIHVGALPRTPHRAALRIATRLARIPSVGSFPDQNAYFAWLNSGYRAIIQRRSEDRRELLALLAALPDTDADRAFSAIVQVAIEDAELDLAARVEAANPYAAAAAAGGIGLEHEALMAETVILGANICTEHARAEGLEAWALRCESLVASRRARQRELCLALDHSLYAPDGICERMLGTQ